MESDEGPPEAMAAGPLIFTLSLLPALLRFMLLWEGMRLGKAPSSEFAIMFFCRLCLLRSLDNG